MRIFKTIFIFILAILFFSLFNIENSLEINAQPKKNKKTILKKKVKQEEIKSNEEEDTDSQSQSNNEEVINCELKRENWKVEKGNEFAINHFKLDFRFPSACKKYSFLYEKLKNKSKQGLEESLTLFNLSPNKKYNLLIEKITNNNGSPLIFKPKGLILGISGANITMSVGTTLTTSFMSDAKGSFEMVLKPSKDSSYYFTIENN